MAALDSYGSSVVVGSRSNGCVYAVHLLDGSTTPGWPRCTGYGIDSTPSVYPAGPGLLDEVFVTSGDSPGQSPAVLDAGHGSITAFGPAGNTLWSRALPDTFSTYGSSPAVFASPAIGDTGSGSPSIVVGDIGLDLYSLDPATGANETGWPQKTADTTFATPAIADIGGRQTIVAASDSTAGIDALDNWNGGAVRTLDAKGQTGWTARSNEVVTSSPAVGNLEGVPAVVYGHGRYWSDLGSASDADGLTAVNAETGATLWEEHLGGYTRGSPALADLLGNGQLDVVEATWTALGQPTGGAVFAFGPGGNKIWGPVVPAGAGNTITGGVATADFGEGYQDVVVATGLGFAILDGHTGAVVDVEGQNVDWDGTYANLTMQNTPLIVPDPSGSGLDIVVAGTYMGSGDNTQGFIAAYRVGTSAFVGKGAWPMFHHDPALSGSGIAPAPPPGTCLPAVPPCTAQGYLLAASDGGIFAYGDAGYHGSIGGHRLAAPIVGVAATPDGKGYWEVASDGGIFAYGDAGYHGSMGGRPLNAPVVGLARTSSGAGYWEVATDGGTFNFGDAYFRGSAGDLTLSRPVVGIGAVG